jgi:hypothetical protein
MWTVRAHDRPFPRFREAPRSMQLGLSSTPFGAAIARRFQVLPNPGVVYVLGTCEGARSLLSALCSGAGTRTPTY